MTGMLAIIRKAPAPSSPPPVPPAGGGDSLGKGAQRKRARTPSFWPGARRPFTARVVVRLPGGKDNSTLGEVVKLKHKGSKGPIGTIQWATRVG
jgi:hypothetical protein